MKTIRYILSITLLASLCLGTSGCSENNELPAGNDDKGIEINSFHFDMQGRTSDAGATTKAPATLDGFSVNKADDPTFAGLAARLTKTWKLDFSIYYTNVNSNKEEMYNGGSFTGATNYTVDATSGIGSFTPTSQRYFPNYKKPQAEAFLYPSSVDATVALPQNTKELLLAQDILTRVKAEIPVSHNPQLTFVHKHSMLDFVIKDVVLADIAANDVTVKVGNDTYTPCLVKSPTGLIGDKEYMVILPEGITGTANNPVVTITTASGTTSSITYKQTIQIMKNNQDKLVGNKCYCFTLQGVKLAISPVTVLNWTTGAAIPGEYIAVTAYPTFKAESHAEETFYFYYDNKLMESDGSDGQKAKLQKITFNKNGECTIKPDGRILTHIFTNSGGTPTDANKLDTTITLDQMIVNVNDALNKVSTTTP